MWDIVVNCFLSGLQDNDIKVRSPLWFKIFNFRVISTLVEKIHFLNCLTQNTHMM